VCRIHPLCAEPLFGPTTALGLVIGRQVGEMPALRAMRFCSGVSGGRTGAPGQFPARAREVTGIAERVALEIVLVLRLGLPEFAGG
jgi:hypothetical protein